MKLHLLRYCILLCTVFITVAAATAEDDKRIAYRYPRLPVGGCSFKCLYCDHTETNVDVLEAVAVSGNKVYQIENCKGALGTSFRKMHVYNLPAEVKNYSLFKQHIALYDDYLSQPQYMLDANGVKEFNKEQARAQHDRMLTIAPNGFLSNVSIDCTAGLKTSFTFTNLSVRKTKDVSIVLDYYDGNYTPVHVVFTGRGELAQSEEATWNLSKPGVACPGSPDSLKLSVIINYTDGSGIVLEGDDVLIDSGQ